MNRAAVSIPSNISESTEGNTIPSFIHFLLIAKSSFSELSS